jgi:hypothetical protein
VKDVEPRRVRRAVGDTTAANRFGPVCTISATNPSGPIGIDDPSSKMGASDWASNARHTRAFVPPASIAPKRSAVRVVSSTPMSA